MKNMTNVHNLREILTDFPPDLPTYGLSSESPYLRCQIFKYESPRVPGKRIIEEIQRARAGRLCLQHPRRRRRSISPDQNTIWQQFRSSKSADPCRWSWKGKDTG